MMEDLIRLGLVDDEEIVLDQAALALASLDHPGLDLNPHHDVLEDIAMRLEQVGGGMDHACEHADALRQVIGDEFGFVGDRESYDDPANADLIRVIDRRCGLPVSLSILYVAAARRLGWTASVLNVPGHVLVVVGDDPAPAIVDPFSGGIVVRPDELARMLTAIGARRGAAVRQVAEMPNRAVLVRLLMNQATRAEQAGRGRRALELFRRMTVVAPGHGQPWWERARLELVGGDVAAARESLTAMLEITREPGLRERIGEMLEKLAAD